MRGTSAIIKELPKVNNGHWAKIRPIWSPCSGPTHLQRNVARTDVAFLFYAGSLAIGIGLFLVAPVHTKISITF
jgi:hypothetical protein